MQVIPQAVCSRHGLAIGANLIWLVKILMVICWPVSYPVGKVLLFLLCPLKVVVTCHSSMKILQQMFLKKEMRTVNLFLFELCIVIC